MSGPSILMALIVNVITTEHNAALVSADELVEPSSWLSGGTGVSEVLDVSLRGVAKSHDVVLSMLSENRTLVQGTLELVSLSCIARDMDGVVGSSSLVPCPSCVSLLNSLLCSKRGNGSGQGKTTKKKDLSEQHGERFVLLAAKSMEDELAADDD